MIRPMPWKTIILLCGKCARKLDGGFGPKAKDMLRETLRRTQGEGPEARGPDHRDAMPRHLSEEGGERDQWKFAIASDGASLESPVLGEGISIQRNMPPRRNSSEILTETGTFSVTAAAAWSGCFARGDRR
jgi:hypothetical protein